MSDSGGTIGENNPWHPNYSGSTPRAEAKLREALSVILRLSDISEQTAPIEELREAVFQIRQEAEAALETIAKKN